MTKQKHTRREISDRDFAGVQTQHLVSYLQTCRSEEILERVLQVAGETRTVAELSDASAWSSYTQFRALLEAAGEVLGGADTLFEVGRHIYDSIQSPDFSEAVVALGSPVAVYAAVPGFMGTIAPVVEWDTEIIGSNEITLSLRVKGR